MERRFLWLLLGMLAVLLVAAGVLLFGQRSFYRGVLYEPPQAAYDFQLPAASGGTTSLHEMRGKLVLLFFGYTSCPDVCPTTMAVLRQVTSDLGALADGVQVVFISVDPERDTPQRVQGYVSAFDPRFIGLSGSLDQLEAVWQAYGVYRQVDDASASLAGYLVAHSTRLYLIDPQGDLLLSYSYGTPPEDILSDLRRLLRKND
jgi:protein SCO1/2